MPSEAFWNMRESFSLKRFSIREKNRGVLEREQRRRVLDGRQGLGYKCMSKLKTESGRALNDIFKTWGVSACFCLLVFVLNNKYWFYYYYPYSKPHSFFLIPVLGFSHSGSDMKKLLQSKI